MLSGLLHSCPRLSSLSENDQCFRGYRNTTASPIGRQASDAAKRTMFSRSV